MFELTATQWVVVIAAAILIGIAKAGFVGASIVVGPLLALLLPARLSTGFLLPMLIVGDVAAVVYWRKHVDFGRILRLIPSAVLGVIGGFLVLGRISDGSLMFVIGAMVLCLVTLTLWLEVYPQAGQFIPQSRMLAATAGVTTGVTSMLTNSSPVMTIYLLASRFRKEEFIATNAWFFLLLNIFKLPFSRQLDLITPASLMTNLFLIPVILLGCAGGILLVRLIPQEAFNRVILFLAGLTAVILCIKPWL